MTCLVTIHNIYKYLNEIFRKLTWLSNFGISEIHLTLLISQKNKLKREQALLCPQILTWFFSLSGLKECNIFYDMWANLNFWWVNLIKVCLNNYLKKFWDPDFTQSFFFFFLNLQITQKLGRDLMSKIFRLLLDDNNNWKEILSPNWNN